MVERALDKVIAKMDTIARELTRERTRLDNKCYTPLSEEAQTNIVRCIKIELKVWQYLYNLICKDIDIEDYDVLQPKHDR